MIKTGIGTGMPIMQPLSSIASDRAASTTTGNATFQNLLQQELQPVKPLDPLFVQQLTQAIRQTVARTAPHLLTNVAASSPSLQPPQSSQSPSSSSPPPPTPLPYADLIQRAADRHDIDPKLITAVVHVESGFNAKAISPKGARGLMQLMPATARELGVVDTLDPEQNLMGGTRYLKQLLTRYRGDQTLALAAYNWGMGNLERHPQKMPDETRRYLTKISQWMEKAS